MAISTGWSRKGVAREIDWLFLRRLARTGRARGCVPNLTGTNRVRLLALRATAKLRMRRRMLLRACLTHTHTHSHTQHTRIYAHARTRAGG